MSKSGKSRPFETEIEKLVYGGEGLGRHNGKVVFVPFAVPGDRLLVRPVEEKKTFVRAEIVRILKPGEARVAPVCALFEKCGGCQWQQVEYSNQVEAKRLILEGIFHHRFPQTHAIPIKMIPCPQPLAYRSRARLQLRGAGARASVGFFRPGSHAIQDVDSCPLFRPALNEALTSLRQFKLKVDTDSRPQEMDLACSQEENTFATARVGISEQGGVALFGSGATREPVLRRRVGEFVYSVTASVFFQANDFMVSELVRLVEDWAGKGDGSALDLFAGVGLFSLPLSHRYQQVVAVDNSSTASRLCAANASAAGIRNLQVVCADVFAWRQSIEPPECEIILLDPPRAGAGTAVMERIREWNPPTILYVSCDPQTLVRDISKIAASDYRIDLVEGLDLFPQTYHFETVVRLLRNS
jgi:23S rRNA (uracil1939-C5)-methyltransferase